MLTTIIRCICYNRLASAQYTTTLQELFILMGQREDEEGKDQVMEFLRSNEEGKLDVERWRAFAAKHGIT